RRLWHRRRKRPHRLGRRGRISRYAKLFDLVGDTTDGTGGAHSAKQMFLLTATPVNNGLIDLQHMVELFSRRQADYFKSIGIHSWAGHFRKMEKELLPPSAGQTQPELFDTSLVEAEKVLAGDVLFRELVVQRSRAYVKESQAQQGSRQALFPKR